MNMMRIARRAIPAVVLGALPLGALATNGDQMLGTTATQWGMAGAFAAAPQDAATVFYNPAGLSQLNFERIRFDTGLGLMNPPRSVNGVDSDSNLYLIPSGAYARKIDERRYFGLGMGGVSGMGVDFPDALPVPGNQAIVTTKQLMRISPSMAFRVRDETTIGASFNINYQSLALQNTAANLYLPQTQTFGYGFNLGITHEVTPAVTLAAAYVSKQHMDELEWNTAEGQFSMTMDEPASLTLAVAYRASDDLLLEFNVKHIDFSEVRDFLPLEKPAGSSVTIDGLSLGWSDQTVYALGIQKRVNEGLTLRGGLNYGESPIGEEDVNGNLGSVAITEWHAAIGLTRHWGDGMSGSISYVHAFENELTASAGPANTIELSQNVVHLQFSFSY